MNHVLPEVATHSFFPHGLSLGPGSALSHGLEVRVDKAVPLGDYITELNSEGTRHVV